MNLSLKSYCMFSCFSFSKKKDLKSKLWKVMDREAVETNLGKFVWFLMLHQKSTMWSKLWWKKKFPISNIFNIFFPMSASWWHPLNSSWHLYPRYFLFHFLPSFTPSPHPSLGVWNGWTTRGVVFAPCGRYFHSPTDTKELLYDPASVMNGDTLKFCLKEAWCKLSFFVLSFFYYLYWWVVHRRAVSGGW